MKNQNIKNSPGLAYYIEHEMVSELKKEDYLTSKGISPEQYSEMKMVVKSKIIPAELKEKFLKKFKNKIGLTGKEIDDFLLKWKKK